MKLLSLRGKYATGERTHTMVDDDVFEACGKLKWYLSRTDNKKPGCRAQYYVCTDLGPYRLYLRRVIMALPNSDIDHIDGNSLNNQRSNLRLATKAENARNRKPNCKSSSKYRGVSWDKDSGKWRVRIRIDGKLLHLGFFICEICAARAYDSHAKHYYGDFARPNLPF